MNRKYLGRIWWKLQSHNFILKIYFLPCAYDVVLITDQFFIKWFFGKNVIFWPKNAFFWEKWLFNPLLSSAQQSCFRTFCSGANFLHSMKKLRWGTLGLKCQTNLNIFNLAKNGSFLSDLRKKMHKSYWNHIHRVYVTQMHYDTWFLTTFLLKIPQFWLKTVIFKFSKIHIFGCFLGFRRWN